MCDLRFNTTHSVRRKKSSSMPWECNSFSRLPLFDARPEPGRQVRDDGASRGLARPRSEWGTQLDLHHSRRVYKGTAPPPPLISLNGSPFGALSTPTTSFGSNSLSGGLSKTPSLADLWGGSHVTKGKRVFIGKPVDEWGDAEKSAWANGGVRTANRSYENMKIPNAPPTPWWLSASTWQTTSQDYGQGVTELPRARSSHHLRIPTRDQRPLGMTGL